MMVRIPPLFSSRLLAAALAMLMAAVAHAQTDDPRAWIGRMNEALNTRNYDGVLVHTFSGRSQTWRIIHRKQGGRMSERLISTDGSQTEFVRDGSKWVEYYPARKLAVLDTRNRSFGFITMLNGLTAESDRYYMIKSGGAQRFQGRNTHLIKVEARDALRYGYRFWLDEENAMPVRTQLVSHSGAVIEEISFIKLDLLATIPDELLKSDVDTTGFHWWKKSVPTHTPGVTKAIVPRADLLPTGFRVRIFGTPDEEQKAKADGPRTRFIVSDSIAWVSVFIEKPDGRPAGVEVMGSLATYVSRVEGYKVTVVGEVPPATVKAIAEALRPE